MENQVIYTYLSKVISLIFSTIEEGEVHSRVAEFYAVDEEGFYFRTMFNRPFAKQLEKYPKLTVCGAYMDESCDESSGESIGGDYTIHLTGDVRIVSEEEVATKAAYNADFMESVKDKEDYPATIDFCLFKGKGELFDYASKTDTNDRLKRTRFIFGEGYQMKLAGCKITERCVACNRCQGVCSFDAISAGKPYKIDGTKCDECGSCLLVCPVNAIEEGQDF